MQSSPFKMLKETGLPAVRDSEKSKNEGKDRMIEEQNKINES